MSSVIRVEARLVWAMPNKYTFQIPEIQTFVRHWVAGMPCVVDPFAGKSAIATLSNDIANGGVDAEVFCRRLLDEGVVADAIIFDPPYSPRQISESYKNAGLKVDTKTTQNAALYSRVLKPLLSLLRPGGIALRCGWQSAGVCRAWELLDLLIVQHGSGHSDTICTAQRKPLTTAEEARRPVNRCNKVALRCAVEAGAEE